MRPLAHLGLDSQVMSFPSLLHRTAGSYTTFRPLPRTKAPRCHNWRSPRLCRRPQSHLPRPSRLAWAAG